MDKSLARLSINPRSIEYTHALVRLPGRSLAWLWAFLAVSSACFGQMGDIIAKHGLVIKGQVDGDLRLLTEGELIVGADATIHGNAAVPEQKTSATTPVTDRGSPSSAVKFANPGGDTTMKGQVLGAATFDLPATTAPVAAKGKGILVIDGSTKPPADFSPIRDLTVRYTYARVAVPAGAYGQLLVEGARVVLGVSGGRKPARYDLETLEIRDNGHIDLAGPVILSVGRVIGIDGWVGRSDLPGWLDLRVASGAMGLGTQGAVYGSIFAPNSALSLADGAKVDGWLAGDTVTIERQGRFRAVRPDWGASRHPSQAPSFPQKAVILQARLTDFATTQASSFSSDISFANDLPILTLIEVPQRKSDRSDVQDQVALFDASCLLLAFTDFEAGRVVIVRSGSGEKAPPIDLTMTKEDFVGHFWALDQREVTVRTMQEIRSDPALLNVFVGRSLKLAAARQQAN